MDQCATHINEVSKYDSKDKKLVVFDLMMVENLWVC